MPQYTYPNSGVIIETGTVTRIRPIGNLYDCVENPFVPCCLCFPVDGQIIYFIEGDTFDFQLDFTADSVTVYNFDGTVIGDFNSWIRPNMVTVNVDDLDPSVNCFYFSVMKNDERKCFDFGFRRHETKELGYCYGGDCGIGTITIESNYTGFDCMGNSYAAGVNYSNKRRFLADVDKLGTIEQAELIDDVRVSSKIYTQYQIRILQPLKQNSRLLKELTKVIMRGKTPIITIDSEFPADVLICEDFVDSLSRGYDSLRDWYPIFTVRVLECDSNLNCE